MGVLMVTLAHDGEAALLTLVPPQSSSSQSSVPLLVVVAAAREKRGPRSESEENLPRGTEICRGDGPQPRHWRASGALEAHP